MKWQDADSYDWETIANNYQRSFHQANAERRFWLLGCAMLFAVLVIMLVASGW